MSDSDEFFDHSRSRHAPYLLSSVCQFEGTAPVGAGAG